MTLEYKRRNTFEGREGLRRRAPINWPGRDRDVSLNPCECSETSQTCVVKSRACLAERAWHPGLLGFDAGWARWVGSLFNRRRRSEFSASEERGSKCACGIETRSSSPYQGCLFSDSPRSRNVQACHGTEPAMCSSSQQQQSSRVERTSGRG